MRFLARVGLITLGGGAVLALIVGGIMTIAPSGSSAITVDDTSAAALVTVAGTPASPASAPRAEPAAAMGPVIPEGRRDLGDSVFAIREGKNVTVHFDTELLRTRFDWKFEGVVRATLPLVFGDVTRPALDSIPTGTLVRGGDLLNELPTRGFPITVGEERLRVWPITRPGRDGPLVVGYRVSATQ